MVAATGPTNATPQRVSSYGDNCAGVDVNNTLINGYPSVVMNCPGANATPKPTVATWNGSSYGVTTSPHQPRTYGVRLTYKY